MPPELVLSINATQTTPPKSLDRTQQWVTLIASHPRSDPSSSPLPSAPISQPAQRNSPSPSARPQSHPAGFSSGP